MNGPEPRADSDLELMLKERQAEAPEGGEEALARSEACFSALRDALEYLHGGEEADRLLLEIRRRFVSPGAFFEAPQHILERAGIPPREAQLFSQIPGLARFLGRSRFGEHPKLKDRSQAAAFLATRYTGLSVEHFYLLCLDRGGRLIDSVLMQSGTTDSAPFYLKHVLMEIVRTKARYAVISHNHPSFSACPSQADIDCTLDLLGAVQPIGTVLLDHIIVSGKQTLSLRAEGYIRSHLWLAQAPEDPLLRGWLGQEGKN